jgi:hypothetical protein
MRKISIILFTLIMGSLFLVNVSVSDFPPAPEGEYSPWGDLNDDGIINIFDIVWLSSRYGTTGTPLNVTELLLELDMRVDVLNASMLSLEEQVALLGQGGCVVEGGKFNGTANSDMVEGPGAATVFNFQNPFTTTEKPLVIVSVVQRQPANGLGEGVAIKAVEDVKGAPGNWTGFDITVSKYSGGIHTIDDLTLLYVTWIAIGKAPEQEASPKECVVVTGSIPYDGNGPYSTIDGLSRDVSSAIPSGFTLVSVFATGYKANEMTGARIDEPPLTLEPKVSGTNIQIRVWDASGEEYGGAGWSGRTAHIDYTLFITK